MFWDNLIRRARREAGVVDRHVLVAAGGHVAVLPGRERRRRPSMLWPVAVALLVALGALLVLSGDVRAFLAGLGV